MKESIAPVLTAQECFNRVAKHLFSQGEMCRDIDMMCLYRQDSTAACPTRCAIGALIPDEKYSSTMERKGVVTLLRLYESEVQVCQSDHGTFVELFKDVFPKDMVLKRDFLAELQSVHDSSPHWISTQVMRNALEKVAQRFGLDYSILVGLSFSDR